VPHLCLRAPEGSRLKIAAAALALGVALLASDGRAAELYGMSIANVGLTERIAIDRISGVAIGGYDPVAYYVAGQPVQGSSQWEAVWAGAAWRFANEGNRAAFLADPEVYAPRFGGYDAEAVAAGVATPGDPRIFAIAGSRLFLFRSAESRRLFLAEPRRLEASESEWPVVERRLIR
jgi:hypothetical protein